MMSSENENFALLVKVVSDLKETIETQSKGFNELKITVAEQNTKIGSLDKILTYFIKNQSSAVAYEVGEAVYQHLTEQGEVIDDRVHENFFKNPVFEVDCLIVTARRIVVVKAKTVVDLKDLEHLDEIVKKVHVKFPGSIVHTAIGGKLFRPEVRKKASQVCDFIVVALGDRFTVIPSSLPPSPPVQKCKARSRDFEVGCHLRPSAARKERCCRSWHPFPGRPYSG